MNYYQHPLYGKLILLDSNNSMGIIRYILAFAVVIAHFNSLFDCHIPFFLSSYNAVGGFFALSGFLLYGSYIRNDNLKEYIQKRSRRILPPYIFIITLCAFLLVYVSTYNCKEYFFNSEWIKYIVFNLSFLNFLQPDLPGVFTESPITAVNGSLWTMKVEIMLYLTVPIVVYLSELIYKKIKYFSPLIIFIGIYVISVIYRIVFIYYYNQTNEEIYLILGRQFIGQLLYFYSGVFLYFIYDKLLKYKYFVIIMGIIVYFILLNFNYTNIVIIPFILSALIISFSSIKGFVSIFNFNNISYDIYLFHFPIIQVFYQFRHIFYNNIPLIFFLSIIVILALSLISWFFIEKRFLPKKFV